ncbi:MAG: DNA internalization-related competence protein ComEC/Rec2 [Dehalococcoidia bacterium]|jgi:competence protein ComEC|nr:DNA internalization-related competence protein ComEC/Rec2 [Dehalococcoidia bacterium]
MSPLILTAAAFIAGTVAAAVLGAAWWATAVLAGLAGITAWLSLDPGTRPAVLVLLAAFAAAGAGHARFSAADQRPHPPIAQLSGIYEVAGTLRRDALVRGTIARLDLNIEQVDRAPERGGLRLTMVAPEQPLQAGDHLRAVVAIERPPEVPDFDYAQYLRARGIHAVAAFPEQWTVEQRAGRRGPRATLRRFRRWLVENLERSLPEPESSLAAGMLLGERRTMPSGLAEDLRDTGTTHLVVVSGQNVAMLLGLAIASLTPLISRRRAAMGTLALLPGYLLLVGLDPPVVRAAIMAVGIAIAGMSGRRTPGWLYLLYAAALMLAVDPLLAHDVAFQLSMSATAGVMLIAPPLRDRLLTVAGWSSEGPRAALLEAVALATGAALAVLPVQAAAFGSFSLLAVPANVIVAPLYEGTLIVAAAASLLGWFDPAAEALGVTTAFVPRSFVVAVGLLARAPSARQSLEVPLVVGAGWYVLLGAAAWGLQRGEAPVLAPGARSGLATSAALAAMAGGLWLAVLSPGQPNTTVTVLDVGQGLAVLVEDGGSRVLVDTGPSDGAAFDALSRAGSTGSAGTIDAVVITHGDNDHDGGLRELQRRLTVGRVFDDGAAAERPDIGDRIRVSPRTTIEVISPPVATAGRAHRSDNNRSLVLLVTAGDRRLLIAADIETEAEAWLVTSGLDLRADAIIVPHHGAKSSSSQQFIDAVQPRVAVVSAGRSNRWGHPDPEVIARYEARGVLLLRTDEDGDVELSSDGRRLWVKTSR